MRWWLRRLGGWIGRWVPRVALGVVAAAVLVGFLAFVLKVVPEWLAQDDLKGKDRAEDVGRARTATLAVLAGVIAGGGAFLTWLSYRLNQAGQLTERFGRAVDQLGNESMDVRIGGIYALERIAKDSRHDHPQVMEVLTAFVREHAAWPPPFEGPRLFDAERRPRLRQDVQAVMNVIGRRRREHDERGAELDLMNTDLRYLYLIHDRAHLEGIFLSGAHLENAYLLDAHLDGAVLGEAHLNGAYLVGVSFRQASMTGAHLERADLEHADLEGANLAGASWDLDTKWPHGIEGPQVTGESPR